MIKWEGTCNDASCVPSAKTSIARKGISPWHFTKPSLALTMMKHKLVHHHLYLIVHNLRASLLHGRFFNCGSIYNPIQQNTEESPHNKKQNFMKQKPATATFGNCHTSSCCCLQQVKTPPKENNSGVTLSHMHHKKDQEMVPSPNTSYMALC